MTSEKGQPKAQCPADLFSFLHLTCGGGAGQRGTASLCYVAIIEPHKLVTAFLPTKTNGIFCALMRQTSLNQDLASPKYEKKM